MLREITTKKLRPVLYGFSFDTSGSQSVTIGKDDVSSTADPGAGRITINHRIPGRRGCVSVGSAFTSVGNGSMCASNPDSSLGSYSQFNMTESTPTATDGVGNGITLIYNSPTTDRVREQIVLGRFTKPRIAVANIASTGVVNSGINDFSCTKTATGTYTITFKRSFGKTPIVVVTPNDASISYATVTSVTAAGCVVATWTALPAAADRGFHLWVYGSAGRDEVGRKNVPVLAPFRLPRMEAYRVNYSGGTPSYGLGAEDATGNPTDNGTGDFTITFKEKFAQAPIIIAAAATSGNSVTLTSVTATSARMRVHNAAGVAADINAHVLVLGSDATDGY